MSYRSCENSGGRGKRRIRRRSVRGHRVKEAMAHRAGWSACASIMNRKGSVVYEWCDGSADRVSSVPARSGGRLANRSARRALPRERRMGASGRETAEITKGDPSGDLLEQQSSSPAVQFGCPSSRVDAMRIRQPPVASSANEACLSKLTPHCDTWGTGAKARTCGGPNVRPVYTRVHLTGSPRLPGPEVPQGRQVLRPWKTSTRATTSR